MNKSRERFEAWYKRDIWDYTRKQWWEVHIREDGRYNHLDVQLAWSAWKAAEAATIERLNARTPVGYVGATTLRDLERENDGIVAWSEGEDFDIPLFPAATLEE